MNRGCWSSSTFPPSGIGVSTLNLQEIQNWYHPGFGHPNPGANLDFQVCNFSLQVREQQACKPCFMVANWFSVQYQLIESKLFHGNDWSCHTPACGPGNYSMVALGYAARCLSPMKSEIHVQLPYSRFAESKGEQASRSRGRNRSSSSSSSSSSRRLMDVGTGWTVGIFGTIFKAHTPCLCESKAWHMQCDIQSIWQLVHPRDGKLTQAKDFSCSRCNQLLVFLRYTSPWKVAHWLHWHPCPKKRHKVTWQRKRIWHFRRNKNNNTSRFDQPAWDQKGNLVIAATGHSLSHNTNDVSWVAWRGTGPSRHWASSMVPNISQVHNFKPAKFPHKHCNRSDFNSDKLNVQNILQVF